MFPKIYLSLGSNLGDRRHQLCSAINSLEEHNIRLTARSSLYETEPREVVDQPWFLNMVVACETELAPVDLLATLLAIERKLGRVRSGVQRRGPRAIDLDILLYGDTTLSTDVLTVPHARMLERRFVLEPLLEIAPQMRYPGTGVPLESYLARLAGQAITRLPA